MVFPENDDMNVSSFSNLIPSSGIAIVGCVIESSNTTNITPIETFRTSLSDIVPYATVGSGACYMAGATIAISLSSIFPSSIVTDYKNTKEDNNNKNCSKNVVRIELYKTDNHNVNLKRMSSDQYKTLKNRISGVIKEHDAKSTSEIKKDPKLEKAVRDEIDKFVTNDLKLATQGNSAKPK